MLVSIMWTACFGQTASDTNFTFTPKQVDFFLLQNVKEKKFERDDSLLLVEKSGFLKEIGKKDSMLIYKNDELSSYKEDSTLTGEILAQKIKELAHQEKVSNRVRWGALTGLVAEALGFGWLYIKK